MGKADSLSRRPDWKVGVEKDNEDQVFIKDHWIHNLSEVVIEGSEIDILEKIKKARGKDKEVVRVVEKIKKVGVRILRGNVANRERVGIKRRKNICAKRRRVEGRDNLVTL